MRITTEGENVRRFTVQYETTVDGERTPVARYDSAHGHPHQDILDRRGNVVDKHWLPDGTTFKEAPEIGRRNLRANWPSYRAGFLGDPS